MVSVFKGRETVARFERRYVEDVGSLARPTEAGGEENFMSSDLCLSKHGGTSDRFNTSKKTMLRNASRRFNKHEQLRQFSERGLVRNQRLVRGRGAKSC